MNRVREAFDETEHGGDQFRFGVAVLVQMGGDAVNDRAAHDDSVRKRGEGFGLIRCTDTEPDRER